MGTVSANNREIPMSVTLGYVPPLLGPVLHHQQDLFHQSRVCFLQVSHSTARGSPTQSLDIGKRRKAWSMESLGPSPGPGIAASGLAM